MKNEFRVIHFLIFIFFLKVEKWEMNLFYFFHKRWKIKQKLNSFFIFQFSKKNEIWKMNYTEFVFHFFEEVKKWN